MADLVFKMAVSVLDERTTMVCLRVAGQVRPTGEPFSTLGGEFQDPPFHYGCRTTIGVWVPGMINDQRGVANTEIRKRPPKERRFGPEGYAGKVPAAPPRIPIGDRLPLALADTWASPAWRWTTKIAPTDVSEFRALRRAVTGLDPSVRASGILALLQMRSRYERSFTTDVTSIPRPLTTAEAEVLFRTGKLPDGFDS